MTSGTDADRIVDLENDNNRRLRRLLDQQNAPSELRHRMRSTLAVLRGIVRRSALSRRRLDDYVAHLEDRIEAIARAAGAADQHGEIDLLTFLTDELHYYGTSEGERLKLLGPDILFQPKAGQVFALAIHELAVNAVEHGQLGVGQGHLTVEWRVDQTASGLELVFIWKETGAPRLREIGPSGFGTEVLNEMLSYELKAHTALTHQPDGLECSIHFAMPTRVARVADEKALPDRTGV